MHKFINELVLTFRNKLVRSINTKTLVNITIRVLYTALFHHKAWFCYYYYYYYYTVSQKVVLSLLERKVSFQQKAYNTSVCCRITLRKLEVRICRNFQKKIYGSCHIWQKLKRLLSCGWILSQTLLEVSAFCPHTCAKTSTPLINALSMMVWSMPCRTSRKRCFKHLFLLFAQIFNKNRKWKQQVSK